MTETGRLLSEIDAFLSAGGMAASTFGRKAVNDGKLVGRLQSGSTVTLEKAARIRAFIRENPISLASAASASAADLARAP